MRAVDLILKKKLGEELTSEEISFIIGGYVDGSIPDYQISAFLMAVYFKGMTIAETATLTEVMRDSGDQVSLEGIKGITVDKHSTGGVGDKTTLTLAPLLAACGLVVAKMSGRGLGHTGGTLDKLEAIEGFNVNLDGEAFNNVVNEHGIAVVGQTAKIVPADKKLYALRDVTATVDNVSLIASSIMSKKLAVANDALVLDVKCGSGAFMKTLDAAKELAEVMVGIGVNVGRKVRAVVTDMNQPLGVAVGNAMEVREAIETLKGKGPADFTEVVLTLASQLLVMTEKAANNDEARKLCNEKINDGSAYKKFVEFVKAQGGSEEAINNMAVASSETKFEAQKSGYLTAVDTEGVGIAAMKLGAGRATKEDIIDFGVGFNINVKIGDKVETGQNMITVFYNDEERKNAALEHLKGVFTISDDEPEKLPVVYDIIGK